VGARRHEERARAAPERPRALRSRPAAGAPTVSGSPGPGEVGEGGTARRCRRRRSAAKVGGEGRRSRAVGRARSGSPEARAGRGARRRRWAEPRGGAGGAGRRGRVRGAEVARAQAARAARAARAERSLRHVLPAEVGVVPALGSRREAGATGTSGGGGTVAWEALGCAKKGGDGRLAAWKGWRRGRRGLPASSSGGPRRRGEAPSPRCSGQKASSILNPRKELLASRPLAAPRGSEGMPL